MRVEQGISEDTPGLEAQLLRYIGYQTAMGTWAQFDTKKTPQPKPIKLPGDDDTKASSRRRKDGRRYDEVMRERIERRQADLARLREADKGS